MPRYFIELAYDGSNLNGFQIQDNEPTVQGYVNDALSTLLKTPIETTTSSRTDAGVHALQNFLHADIEQPIPNSVVYNLNAILPPSIAIKNIYLVPDDAHARFDARYRKYAYKIHFSKNPFILNKSFYYPFRVNFESLHTTAAIIKEYQDFTSFSKKHTDVKTFICRIEESYWELNGDSYTYHVQANRFLRGMVKALVGTQLRIARNGTSPNQIRSIIESQNCQLADFSPRSEGLFLENVIYPDELLANPLPHR